MALTLLAACAGHGAHSTVAGPADFARPVVVLETEETLWPDPVERTHVRLESLRNLLEDERRERGSLPGSLSVIAWSAGEQERFTRDGWGGTIRYELLEGEYRLVSAGPDGIFGTGDDLIADRDYQRPILPRPPGSATLAVLRLLRMHVTIYHERNGRLPDRLTDLEAGGLALHRGTTDEWGQPILYTRTGDRPELRSMGPDATLHTDDDLVLHGFEPLLQHRGTMRNVRTRIPTSIVDSEEDGLTQCIGRTYG